MPMQGAGVARVTPSKDGFTLRGLLPPALRGEPDTVKIQFYSYVLQVTLKEKDRELAEGKDKDGKPLRPISPRTRKYRRSAMTPSGKGDPSAPPLMPGRALSRTRSLLTGRAFPDRCEIWWSYDPLTYDSWARILEYQRDRWPGRDVFGLSQDALARVTARSWKAFARWQAGRKSAPPPPPPIGRPVAPAPRRLPTPGRAPTPTAEPGMGPTPHPAGVESTGGLTWPEWSKRLRQPAPTPRTGRRRPFNVLLRMIFG